MAAFGGASKTAGASAAAAGSGQRTADDVGLGLDGGDDQDPAARLLELGTLIPIVRLADEKAYYSGNTAVTA